MTVFDVIVGAVVVGGEGGGEALAGGGGGGGGCECDDGEGEGDGAMTLPRSVAIERVIGVPFMVQNSEPSPRAPRKRC